MYYNAVTKQICEYNTASDGAEVQLCLFTTVNSVKSSAAKVTSSSDSVLTPVNNRTLTE